MYAVLIYNCLEAEWRFPLPFKVFPSFFALAMIEESRKAFEKQEKRRESGEKKLFEINERRDFRYSFTTRISVGFRLPFKTFFTMNSQRFHFTAFGLVQAFLFTFKLFVLFVFSFGVFLAYNFEVKLVF